MDRIKQAWGSMNGDVKRFIAYSYFAGMAFFFVAWIAGAGFVELGIALGFASALVIEPLIETDDLGNKARDVKTIFRFRFAGAIIMAVALCYLISFAQFQIGLRFWAFEFEPIPFGLDYGSLYCFFAWVVRKIRGSFHKP